MCISVSIRRLRNVLFFLCLCLCLCTSKIPLAYAYVASEDRALYLLLRQGAFELPHQGAFQLLSHDHTVKTIHERDILVYNITTVDPNENIE
jgi:hypothetical protein